MSTRALFVAGGLLLASFGPALSDSVTATVIDWDATTRTITLDDQSKFMDIPATVAVPPNLKPGDEITIEYQGAEDGVEAINRVDYTKDFAKRLLSIPKRG